MPFEDEEVVPNKTLKQVSSQKSMFDSVPKKPSAEEFNNKVKSIEDHLAKNKLLTQSLMSQYNNLLNDKTLVQNKNPFQKEFEKEVLAKMVKHACDFNNDLNEDDGIGSVIWISQLFNVTLFQRNKLNQLEYDVAQLKKALALDKPSPSE